MSQESRTIGLNRTYQTTSATRGQTGTPWFHEASGRRDHLVGHLAGDVTCGKNSAGRKYWSPSWPVS